MPEKDAKFFSDISKLRKTKSGGKSFVDKERAKEMQKRSVESRLRKKNEKAQGSQTT